MPVPMRQPYQMENPPADDLAGLRNKVRFICRAAASRDYREAGLQADDLLDSLLGADVRFSWGGMSKAAFDEQCRADVAAFSAACPSMVD